MATPRVLIYENARGWRYFWREGDGFAHLLRAAQVSADLKADCVGLSAYGAPPPGSISCLWTPTLFAEGGAQLIAIYDPARSELRYQRRR